MKLRNHMLLLWAMALPCGIASAASAPSPAYDIVIANGRVIDPGSGRDEVANIGINGRTIVAIAASTMRGRRTVNARGLVVAPGFVDLHAHGQNPKAQYYQVLDGVTTAIDMEIGAAPISAFMADMKGRALINFGASAAHLCARSEVISNVPCRGAVVGSFMPDDNALTTATSEAQEDRIVAFLDQELAAGALGYGVGIEYAPGTGRRELFRIFKAASASHYPVFVHVRARQPDRAPGVPIAVIQEVLADAAVTGASLQIVHVASTALQDTPTALEMIRLARARGIDVTTEAYPYNAASSPIGSEAFAPGWQKRLGIDYGDLLWPATGERLTAESFERYRKNDPGAFVIKFSMAEEIVDMAMADPNVTIASDGLPWTSGGEHPRGAGTFGRVLGRYVRERGALDLRTALAKMTVMPATRLAGISAQMSRKGRLQPGFDADITIFDPEKVQDRATYEKPMQASAGIRHVIVNGVPIVRDGQVLPRLFPGEAIKGNGLPVRPDHLAQ